jgi:hypothetical protein
VVSGSRNETVRDRTEGIQLVIVSTQPAEGGDIGGGDPLDAQPEVRQEPGRGAEPGGADVGVGRGTDTRPVTTREIDLLEQAAAALLTAPSTGVNEHSRREVISRR